MTLRTLCTIVIMIFDAIVLIGLVVEFVKLLVGSDRDVTMTYVDEEEENNGEDP